jgi:hypothetical protein
VSRADAIEVVKRLFIAEKCASPSRAAAVATILFDEAMTPPSQERGFSRDELTDAVDRLTNEWKLGNTNSEDVHRELFRLSGRLRKFSSKHLPMMGVTAITGPTRNQRADGFERLFLAIEYTPSAEEHAGAVGQIVENALRSIGGEEKLKEYETAIASGAPYEVFEGRGHASLRHRIVVLSVAFLVAGGLLADPDSRRWIFRVLRPSAWVMPRPSAPPPAPRRRAPKPSPSALASTTPGDLILPDGTDVQAIVAVGSRAYIAAGRRGLLVADITDRGLTLLGSYPMTVARDVAVAGDTAYVAATGAGVFVLDVSNPSQIRRVGILQPIRASFSNGMPAGGGPHSVTVHGSMLAVAEVIGCSFYDITEPQAPKHFGEYVDTDAILLDVDFSGTTAVVANGMRGAFGGSIRTIDISDVHHPQLLATLGAANGFQELVLHEHTVYAANEAGGLRTLDISDPRNISTLATWPGAIVNGIVAKDRIALVTTHRGAAVFDLTDPAQPTLRNWIEGSMRGVGFIDGRMCAVTGTDLRCQYPAIVPLKN